MNEELFSANLCFFEHSDVAQLFEILGGSLALRDPGFYHIADPAIRLDEHQFYQLVAVERRRRTPHVLGCQTQKLAWRARQARRSPAS